MTKQELKSRLSGKTTILSCFYLYSYLNSTPTLCIFLDLISDSDDESDEKGKQLEEDIVTHFSRNDYESFNKISQFLGSYEDQMEIHERIKSYWTVKAKIWITELLQKSIDENTDYIFTFIPKSI